MSGTQSHDNQDPSPDTATHGANDFQDFISGIGSIRRRRGNERDRKLRSDAEGSGKYTKPALKDRRAKRRVVNKCVRAARKNNR